VSRTNVDLQTQTVKKIYIHIYEIQIKPLHPKKPVPGFEPGTGGFSKYFISH